MHEELLRLSTKAVVGELAQEFIYQLQLQTHSKDIQRDASSFLVASTTGAQELAEALESLQITDETQFFKLIEVAKDRLERLRVSGNTTSDRDERIHQLLSFGQQLKERIRWYGLGGQPPKTID